MLNQKIYENWQWVCLWILFILTALYSRPLIPIDETRYLSVAWEMWQSNDFLVPHINGEPYSHKPPLLFWFIHLSWFIFGVGEWSGRLVGPLFGLGSIALTVRLADLLWPENKDVRQAAPFILLGLSVWTIFGSLAMFDTLLTFFSLLGLISILKAERSKSIVPWIELSVAIGLGILAKGPIVLLYICPSIFFVPLWRSQKMFSWKRWFTYSLCALVTGIGIAGCWAIPAAWAGGEEYSQAILFSQTAGRMVQSFAHNRPFYWYLLLSPILCLPWFFWLPSWRGWNNAGSDRSVRFCLSALIPTLILLSLVSGKQIHYVMPVLPIGALLLARIVTAAPRRTTYDNIPILIVFLLLSIVLLVVPQLSLHGGDTDMLKHIPKWIAVVPLGSSAVVLFLRSNSVLGSVKAVTISILVLIICLHLAIANPLHEIYDQSVISKAVKKVQSEKRIVAVFPANLSDQFQFSGRLTTPLMEKKSSHEITVWAQSHRHAFCLMYTKDSKIRQLPGSKLLRPYKDGWLIFRSAAGFDLDYEKWVNITN